MNARFPTRKEFEAWMDENPDAGEANDPHTCPLAVCLADRGAKDPHVERDMWSLDCQREGRGYRPMPLWAQRFVDEFDLYWRKPAPVTEPADALVNAWERRFRPGATLHVLETRGPGDDDSAGPASGDARAVSPIADTAPGSPRIKDGRAFIAGAWPMPSETNTASGEPARRLLQERPSEPTAEALARRYWVHHQRISWQYGEPVEVVEWEDLPEVRRRSLVQVFAAVLDEEMQ